MPRAVGVAIHLSIDAMARKRTCDDMRRVMPVHPTVSERIPTLLEQLKPL
jgi:pyruvate/2-oxoglutarate dehydrogenase complex dihydrolipoamide dehydrogenase (E3) component